MSLHDESYLELIKPLRETRLTRGMTLEDVARKIKRSPSWVSRAERGLVGIGFFDPGMAWLKLLGLMFSMKVSGKRTSIIPDDTEKRVKH